MKMHEFISVPVGPVNIALSGEQTEFLLGSLYQSHHHMVTVIRDPQTPKEERNVVYQVALSLEKLYHHIFNQLGIHKVDRDDLH